VRRFLAALLVSLSASCAHPRELAGQSLALRGGQDFPIAAAAGRPVVIHFFATYCGPCLLEVAKLNRLRDRHPALAVIAVAFDREGELVVGPWIEAYQPRYAVALADEEIREGRSAFGRVPALPTTLLLDARGRQIRWWMGALPDEAEAHIVRALDVSPVKSTEIWTWH
jgi:thiol-disulfide isomerase/thioredoxin